MKNDIQIKLEGVRYDYDGFPAIRDINLEVREGEFLGIIGPNGSGKTTVLKVILGLLEPQQGTVQLFGHDIHTFSDWQKIGYVSQKAGADITRFPISVKEVVGMSGADRKAVTEALIEVEMLDQQHKLLKELSGGQQQRIFIARALATKPSLLILDEPTGGVDVDSQMKFYKLLGHLNHHLNVTLILVSHDIEVVAHEVSEVACINRTLICRGTPKDVLTNEYLEKLYGKEIRYVLHGHE